jgi:hypothetical protein
MEWNPKGAELLKDSFTIVVRWLNVERRGDLPLSADAPLLWPDRPRSASGLACGSDFLLFFELCSPKRYLLPFELSASGAAASTTDDRREPAPPL